LINVLEGVAPIYPVNPHVTYGNREKTTKGQYF
jgi:hypothetical protein